MTDKTANTQTSAPERAMQRRERSETIGDELFALVERDQGNAFIADDMGNWDAQRVLDRAHMALQIQRDMNRKLAAWIKRKSGAVTR